MTPAHQQTIDRILRVVSVHALELVGMMNFVPADLKSDMSLETLRQSKFANYLTQIAEYAEGNRTVSAETVRRTIQRVMRILFKVPFDSSDEITLPKDFHRGELGKLINEAYRQIYIDRINDLIPPSEARRRLGVSRQALYDFIRDPKKLMPIYIGGRAMLLGEQVDALAKQRKGAGSARKRHNERSI